VLDTRTTGGALGPGAVRQLQVTDTRDVPSQGVHAVVMNVTVTGGTAGSYLTVYPDGAQRPTASNLNWVAGQTVPNLAEVEVGNDGMVDFYNAAGSVQVIADLEGWVATPSAAQGPNGQYLPLAPRRVLDTRDGTGGTAHPIDQQPITVQVAEPGQSAVVLNLTATDPTTASYLTVWPHGTTQPTASNLNFAAGQTVANRVVVQVSTDGKVDIYNAAGRVNVIADLNGWYTGGSSTGNGALFTGTSPSRVLDTRNGGAPIPGGQHLSVALAGVGPVPSDAIAVVANVTATNTTAASYLTAWPSLQSQPTASDLNWVARQTVPNLVVVTLGTDGKADFYNAAGATDLVIDVVGWYR
jgi:hypothetical protein